LHDRIAVRFRQMLASGLVEEVQNLYQRDDLDLSLPSMRSVGYRQGWQYLAGEYSFDAMAEKGIVATSQLATRQVTGLRSWNELRNFDSENPETLNLLLKSFERITI